MRRLTGLVTTLLMLHLALMSRDAQCTTRAASAGASMAMMHGVHMDGDRVPSDGRQPGRHTPSGDCCQSMTQCGLSAVLLPGLTVGAPPGELAVESHTRTETPRLRGAPPTPPPRV